VPAVTSEPSSEILDLIKETAADLFPHITQISNSSSHAVPAVFARKWQKQVSEIRISGKELRNSRAGYYALPPWLNFYEQDVYQPDPREQIIVKRATLYGQPGPQVVLLCEGKSDRSAFEYLLDMLFPIWKKMKMIVFQTRGRMGIPFSADFADQLGVRFVPLADYDAAALYRALKSDPNWVRVFEAVKAEPVIYLMPDLEGCDVNALLAVVTELNPRCRFDRPAVTRELDSYVSAVRKGAMKPAEGGTLKVAASALRRHWRGGRPYEA
jgi:OLD-like protein